LSDVNVFPEMQLKKLPDFRQIFFVRLQHESSTVRPSTFLMKSARHLCFLAAALSAFQSLYANVTFVDTLQGRLFTASVAAQSWFPSSQQNSEWCWAASVSNIFSYYKHPVNQARIVSGFYGAVVNLPAGSGYTIAVQLNRPWVDDAGRPFNSYLTSAYDFDAGINTISNALLVEELTNNRPIFYANVQHAMVLVAVQYFSTQFGPNIVAAQVYDPLPGVGLRTLSDAELKLMHLGGVGRFIATVRVVDPVPPPIALNSTRLSNLAIRSIAGAGDQTLTVGFALTGLGGKALLARGAGPSLAQFGVKSPASATSLSLWSGTQSIASNIAWGQVPGIATVFQQVKAFPYMSTTSRDSAIFSSVPTGGNSYTLQLADTTGSSGIGLVELYDANPTDVSSPRLTNISARSQVGTGENVLIAGFTISGTTPIRLLVRGVGPTLASFGVRSPLADPVLEIRSGAALVASNDNWSGLTTLSAAFTSVGAFSLPATSRDAALLVTLQPGQYTANVSGISNSTGIGLIEVYEVP
jgi:hypothetical protein